MHLRPRQVWGVGVLVATVGLLALVGLASERAPFDVEDDVGGVQGPAWLAPIFVAFFVVVVAAGLVIIVSARRAPSIGRPPRRPSVLRLLLVLAVAFALALILQTSRGGDQEAGSPETESESSEPEGPGSGRRGGPPWAAIVLGSSVLVVLAGAALTRRHMVSQDERDDEMGARGGAVDSIDESLDQLLAGADDRAAILAAYATLLQRLRDAGHPRRPDEAPGEYVTRVLRRLDVRPEPLTELTVLFAEARFSEHPMGADHRRRAVEALGAARADLLRESAAEAGL